MNEFQIFEAKMRTFTTRLALVGTALALAGCAPGPLLKATTEAVNFGQELPSYMVKTNLIGTIGFDEAFIGTYRKPTRGLLYMQGLEEETPEYQYRAVHVELRFLKGAYLWKDGEYGYRTGAVVPDHMPLLKAGDIIEIRHTGTYYTLKGFAKSGEGNSIVRILCRKASPDYGSCVDALPKTGEYKAQGYTGTPYLPSLQDYGFKFTPAYSSKGEKTRTW